MLIPRFKGGGLSDEGINVRRCGQLFARHACSDSTEADGPLWVNQAWVIEPWQKIIEHPIPMELSKSQILKRRKTDEWMVPERPGFDRKIVLAAFFLQSGNHEVNLSDASY
jgi:hypothetical protein